MNIIPINPPQDFFLSKKYLETAVWGVALSDIKVNYMEGLSKKQKKKERELMALDNSVVIAGGRGQVVLRGVRWGAGGVGGRCHKWVNGDGNK